MGVWGASVFSDDNACDIRDDYRQMIGDGLSGTEATDHLLQEWKSIESDPDLAATFWLALALTQWKCGRLEERVSRNALRAIEDGAALRPWIGTPYQRKRQQVLDAAKQQLASRQPPERKIAKQFRSSCVWEPGELIAYRLRSRDFIVLQVIDHHTDKGGVAPVCQILNWQGSELPSIDQLRALPVRMQYPLRFQSSVRTPRDEARPQYRLMIGQVSKREFPTERVLRLNAKLPILRPQAPEVAFNLTTVCLWRNLDETLERHYGFR